MCYTWCPWKQQALIEKDSLGAAQTCCDIDAEGCHQPGIGEWRKVCVAHSSPRAQGCTLIWNEKNTQAGGRCVSVEEGVAGPPPLMMAL